MAATRVQSVFSYRSIASGQSYYFDIAVDQSGNRSLRNIQNSRGLIIDTASSLPASVVDDIDLAMDQVGSIMATTSAINGTVSFSDNVSKSVTFSTALLTSTYRVYVNIDGFIPWRVTSKTTAGFTIDLSSSYTGTVSYDVFL